MKWTFKSQKMFRDWIKNDACFRYSLLIWEHTNSQTVEEVFISSNSGFILPSEIPAYYKKHSRTFNLRNSRMYHTVLFVTVCKINNTYPLLW